MKEKMNMALELNSKFSPHKIRTDKKCRLQTPPTQTHTQVYVVRHNVLFKDRCGMLTRTLRIYQVAPL